MNTPEQPLHLHYKCQEEFEAQNKNNSGRGSEIIVVGLAALFLFIVGCIAVYLGDFIMPAWFAANSTAALIWGILMFALGAIAGVVILAACFFLLVVIMAVFD